MQKILQKYLLLIAMTIGILFYKQLSIFTPIIPYFLSAMLFITYCRVRWIDIRLTKFHYILLAIQYAGSALVYLVIRPFSEIVAQASMICVLNATATAAPVITGILGGNIASVAAYAVVSNLLLAFMAPIYLSIVGNVGDEIPFFTSLWYIFRRVMPILIAPFVLAFLLSKISRKAHEKVRSAQIVSFYLWATALTIVVATVTKSAISNYTGDYTQMIVIAVISLLICLAQFFFGRKLGSRFKQTVAGGQSLGQKNGVLAIWLTQTYMNPAASLGPGLYVLWQNLVNSYQIWQKKRFEEKTYND
jgi:BASS family bile acid:Na+ symporter